MIKSYNLRQIRMLDFFQVVSNIATHLDRYPLNDLLLEEVSNTLKTALSELDIALKPIKSSTETKKIHELDSRRDRALVGLNAYIKSFIYHYEEAKVTAATKLKNELDKYGKSPQLLPLREETAMITNLIQDLQISENSTLLATIGAEAWISELQSANTEFENLYNSRTQEDATVEVGKSKEARQKTQEALFLLCQTINARILLDGESNYKSLSDEIEFELKRAKNNHRTKPTQNNGETPSK